MKPPKEPQPEVIYEQLELLGITPKEAKSLTPAENAQIRKISTKAAKARDRSRSAVDKQPSLARLVLTRLAARKMAKKIDQETEWLDVDRIVQMIRAIPSWFDFFGQ